MIDRPAFWREYKARFGRVRSSRVVASVETLLELGEQRLTVAHIYPHGCLTLVTFAYILATVRHETAGTYRPIREYGRGGTRRYSKACVLDARSSARYYGRGYVQLTWLANYAAQSVKLGIDLVSNPDKVLEPSVAWRILVDGMLAGDFNPKGHGLDYYLSRERMDWFNARRTVNLTDKASEIGKAGRKFFEILEVSTSA